MYCPPDSVMEYWPYTSAGSEVETALHVPTGVVVGVLLIADAVAAGVGAAAVVACGAVAGGDDELHAESVAARASTDAGAMNMVSFKSFFPSSFFVRPCCHASLSTCGSCWPACRTAVGMMEGALIRIL